MAHHTHDFNVDAENLHKAMAGLGTDDSVLIGIIGQRSRSDLHQIDLAYRLKYGRPLVDSIKSETSGHYERVLVNVVQPPEVTDAIYLHDALAELFNEDSVLDEILTTRDGAEIDAIKMAYTEIFRNSIESKIKWDTTGKYETLLVTLLNGPRGRGNPAVDLTQADADAMRLFSTPTEATFIGILGNNSHAQNLALRDAFEQRYGIPIVSHVKKSLSGHFEKACIALVTPRAEYFAERAYKAMKGMGTDDERLIRVITTRYGVDLAEIKHVFQRQYNKTLFDMVSSEIGGNYKKIMLEIIGSA